MPAHEARRHGTSRAVGRRGRAYVTCSPDRRFGGEVLIGGPTARLVAHWCGASRLVTRARGFTFRGTVRAAPARRSSPTSHPLAANPSRWPLFTGPVTVSLVDREVPDSASGTSQGFHSASMTRAFASPTGRKTALESEADAGTRTPDPFITSEMPKGLKARHHAASAQSGKPYQQPYRRPSDAAVGPRPQDDAISGA